MEKLILDCCCGSKMFWYEKDAPYVMFTDIRRKKEILSDGRTVIINPDQIEDFTNLSFPDEQFEMVVFDPPHLNHAGDKSWLVKKYGILPTDWKPCMRQGFREAFRVLKKNGILVFKWSTVQIPFNEVIQLSPYRPLLGDKKGKTRWTIFVKREEEKNDKEKSICDI